MESLYREGNLFGIARQALSTGELANQVVHYLQARGVGPGFNHLPYYYFFQVRERRANLKLHINYETNHYEYKQVAKLAEYFFWILEAIVSDPYANQGEFEVIFVY